MGRGAGASAPGACKVQLGQDRGCSGGWRRPLAGGEGEVPASRPPRSALRLVPHAASAPTPPPPSSKASSTLSQLAT